MMKPATLIIGLLFLLFYPYITASAADRLWVDYEKKPYTNVSSGQLSDGSYIGGRLTGITNSAAPGFPQVHPVTIGTRGQLTIRDIVDIFNEGDALLASGSDFRIKISPKDSFTSFEDLVKERDNLLDNVCIDRGPDSPPECGTVIEIIDKYHDELMQCRDIFAFIGSLDVSIDADNDGSTDIDSAIAIEKAFDCIAEAATIHLIYGNEFFADAVDFAFGDIQGAEAILVKEIFQLTDALDQFDAAVEIFIDTFSYTLNDWRGTKLIDLFKTTQDGGKRLFGLFSTAVKRKGMALGEKAVRYRILHEGPQGADDAIADYSDSATKTYLSGVALATVQTGNEFQDNGGREVVSTIALMRAQVKSIFDGLNPYGYPEDFVPIQTFRGDSTSMYEVAEALWSTADSAEDDAKDANREYEMSRNQLLTELRLLRMNDEEQLAELCGSAYLTDCNEGIILERYYALLEAEDRLKLAKLRFDNIPAKIAVEEERAGAIITITDEYGTRFGAIDSAMEIQRAVTMNVSAGTSLAVSVGVACDLSCGPTFSATSTLSLSVSKSWNPNAGTLADLANERALLQAMERVGIENANSASVVKNLLIEQAELAVEIDIAVQQANQRSAEFNNLLAKWRRLLELLEMHQDDMLDIHRNNPAFKIMKEDTTLVASRALQLAAQFTYLGSQALKYKYVLDDNDFYTDRQYKNDIFKTRTSATVRQYLDNLNITDSTYASPGSLSRYEYIISIAQDIIGLTDENIDPLGNISPTELAAERFSLFQQFIAAHTYNETDVNGNVTDTILEFDFSTSLLQERSVGQKLFSPNLYDLKISGAGLPNEGINYKCLDCNGLSINIDSSQLSPFVPKAEVVLSVGGVSTIKNIDGELVPFKVGNAVAFALPTPEGYSKPVTAVITAEVMNSGEGIASSQLFNRPLSASSWKLKIQKSSPDNVDLDLSLIKDIVLTVDATAFALP